jgi:hypothetical protein
MSEKKKKQVNRLGTIPFVVLWTLAYGLGWATLMAGGIITGNLFPQVFEWFPLVVYFMLLGAVPGFVSSVAQQLLMRWKFAARLGSWWLWSTLAWIVAGGLLRLFEYIQFRSFDERTAIMLVFAWLFTIPAIVQAWLLRRRVRRAWMWPVAAAASAATFAVPLLSGLVGPFNELLFILTFGFAGLLQGAVMGLTMVWLFGMTQQEVAQAIEADRMSLAENNLDDGLDDVEADAIQPEEVMRYR